EVRRARVGDDLAADAHREVTGDDVASLSGTGRGRRLQGGVGATDAVELGVDGSVVDGDLRALRLEAFVGDALDGGQHLDPRLVREGLARLEALGLDRGRGHGLHLLFSGGLRERLV